MPIPKAPFQPILTWLDSRGYDLSSRIWNVSEQTVANLDLLLEHGIAEGRSAVSLAKDLEQYLLPGRTYTRTNTPYGSDGSYFSMRLARSEITMANSSATKIAGIANPFVDRMYYNLSASHVADAGDPCEEFADYSDANNGYPPEDCPIPVLSTHSNCLCFLTQGTMSPEDAVALIRDDLNAQEDAALFTDDNLFAQLENAIWGLAGAEIIDRILG